MNTPHDTAPPTSTEHSPRRWPWWTPWVSAAAVAVAVIGIGSWIVFTDANTTNDAMNGMASTSVGMPPPVTGYYHGQRIQFLHTETSDAEVAGMLTDMMGGSPVIHTPRLAKADSELLARVYVFTNGIQPDGSRGPFGYQPDVFDSVPGDPGYSPLRTVILAAWQPGSTPRLLTTAEEVEKARQNNDIDTTEPGIVVNMPITTWPGGHR